MKDPGSFEAFYASARQRLLTQTYAVTGGDLTASRSAVRDAFIRAAHHWERVSRRRDPEAWVRLRAWKMAGRRHALRLGRKHTPDDESVAATLAALAKLTPAQRKTLILRHLALVEAPWDARELGMNPAHAEEALGTGLALFSAHREVAPEETPALLAALEAPVRDARLPRPSLVRRTGGARRRSHALVGVTAVVAATGLAGIMVTEPDTGTTPVLAGDAAPSPTGSTTTSPSADPAESTRPEPAPEEAALSVEDLLVPAQLGRVQDTRWRSRPVSDNTDGDGLVLPCQLERFADPEGEATLVQTHQTVPTGKKGKQSPVARVQQLTELSADPAAARAAFDRVSEWYAACDIERAQLLSTQQVDGVGDQAMLWAIRSWQEPSTYLLGVARTGSVVTTTAAEVPGDRAPDLAVGRQLLAAAVNGVCGSPGAGRCAAPPESHEIAPVPVGDVPGVLRVLDLPPVTGVDQPWEGTEPRQYQRNYAALGCARADFGAAGMTNAATRSFLMPDAGLPDTFAITQVVGTMAEGDARGFVNGLRNQIDTCTKDNLGTDADIITQRSNADEDLIIWEMSTDLSDDRTLTYQMAIMRRGTAVSQLGFFPAADAGLAPGSFATLVDRALGRLEAMPAPEPEQDKNKKGKRSGQE